MKYVIKNNNFTLQKRCGVQISLVKDTREIFTYSNEWVPSSGDGGFSFGDGWETAHFPEWEECNSPHLQAGDVAYMRSEEDTWIKVQVIY